MTFKYGNIDICSAGDATFLIEVQSPTGLSLPCLNVAQRPVLGAGKREFPLKVSVERVFASVAAAETFCKDHVKFWDNFFRYPEDYLGYELAGRVSVTDFYAQTWSAEEAALESVNISEHEGAYVKTEYIFKVKELS